MGKHLISSWEPETPAFWRRTGKPTARRNLWISIPALVLAFAVWMVWSVLVVSLPAIGFTYSTNQLFWLTALPGLSGATLRIFYSFMVPIFGGRKWTAISTASLLIPAIGIGLAVQDVHTGYPTMLALALLCGLGGGNFASSMANIGFFYPQAQKGVALGLNGGFGKLGVALVQLVTPLAIGAGVFGAFGGAPQEWSAGGRIWLQNAGFIWVPLIVLASAIAWFGMNDLASARAPFAGQAVIFRRKHNWLICWLSTGAFGSFIGYSAAFPLLIKTQFPLAEPLALAFLGPLAGALGLLAGGYAAGLAGAARVTLWSFVLMIAAALGVLQFLPHAGAVGNVAGFFWMFMLLFACAGVANASTSRMVAPIFLAERRRAAAGKGRLAQELAAIEASRETAAVLGFSSAVAASGAFFIPKSFGTAIALGAGLDPALWCFIAFYASCVAITWWCYARKNADLPC
jgi:NNP family nitrate/nitrite transporter-like MFS transporter